MSTTEQKLYTQAEVDAIRERDAQAVRDQILPELLKARAMVQAMMEIEKENARRRRRGRTVRPGPDIGDAVLNILTLGMWGNGR